MSFNASQASFVRLRDHYAERRRPIVFWIGAGLSTDAGLPTWIGLRNQIINQAMESISTLDPKEAAEAEHNLERAKADENLWDAFQLIKKTINETEFREAIKYIFKNISEQQVPDIYNILWSLANIDGILSLNIDSFALRAHRTMRTSEDVLSFNGRESKEYISAISSGRKFIANLHGQKDAYSSWVFTRNEIDRLASDDAYKDFINFVFSSMTVVFLGISADDMAAGGFLERLTTNGLDVGPHFWITNRTDKGLNAWSGRSGVQIVRYKPEIDVKGKQNHAVVLAKIFEELQGYTSKDAKPAAIIPSTKLVDDIPNVKELRQKDEDEAREILSGYAKKILEKNNSNTSSEEYKAFLETYSPVIYQTWHLTDKSPYNIFFGYKVLNKISNSAFSSVWRLSDEASNYYALKIIQIDNIQVGPQIDSFRRGVQSLKYLSNAEVPGTADIVAAHEIPSAVIMRFIEGSNLTDISNAGEFDFWREGTNIVINICSHLEYSHNLPASVLHRDIRPSNIMVPNYYWSDIEAIDYGLNRFETVLLNYDMSWHKNAKGQTITGNLEEAGFYAPELLENSYGSLARRTSVDVYGVGMTLFYIYTNKSPPSGGSKSLDWQSILSLNFRIDHKIKWRSATEFLKRLIISATNPDESKRISLKNLRSRLNTITNAVKGNYSQVTIDLWAEELISRSTLSEYLSNESETEFTRKLKAGRIIACKADFLKQKIEIIFSNIATESTDRARAAKSWGDRLKTSKEILRSGGWRIESQTGYRDLNILLAASIGIEDLKSDFDKSVKVLNRGLDQIKLD